MIQGNYDSSGLEALKRKYQKAQKEWPAFHLQVLTDVANEVIANTKLRTPVASGRLRENWFLGDISQDVKTVTIEIYNNTEYASHVEFGHKQEPGRYVPAIGKRLVKPKVEGKFMFTKSMNEASRDMEERLKKEFAKFWESMNI